MELRFEHDGVVLRTATLGDWANMKPRVRELDAMLLGPLEDMVLSGKVPLTALVTAVHSGQPIAMCAVLPVSDDVHEICAVTTHEVENCKAGFCRVCHEFVDLVAHGVIRLQCHVLTSHDVSRRWVERMGFVYEGTARKYLKGGHDAALYARVI